MKPIDAFHLNASSKDGLQFYCKPCMRTVRKGHPVTHPDGCGCKGCVQRFIDATGTKRCPKCGETKPVSEYYLHKNGRPQAYCKKCGIEIATDNRKKLDAKRSPDELARRRFERRLARYNLTEFQFFAFLEVQQWRCACGDELTVEDLHIDHDHKCCSRKNRSCGKCVRGLLCQNCNIALGNLKDDPDRAIALANYLMQYNNGLQLTLKGS